MKVCWTFLSLGKKTETVFERNLNLKSRNLSLNFIGNPLHCNCLLRPISFWLASVGRSKGRSGPWQRTKCASPQYYEGFPVDSLIEEQLICDKTEEASKFKVNPDIQFREVEKQDDKVKLRWYVNTNEDVGGFRLELRSSGIPQTTLFSKELPYNQREEVIKVDPEFGNDWTMCVLVENSAGRLRRWKQENCRKASLISSGLILNPPSVIVIFLMMLLIV